MEGVVVKLDTAETRAENEAVEQRLAFTLAEPKEGVMLLLRGTVTASEEAFPAETRGEAQKRFGYVRNSVGLSHNLRNNAVYDRRWDLGPFVKRKQPILLPTPDSRFHCPVRGTKVRWEEQNVYNPAAVVRDGKVYLLYRADDKSPDLPHRSGLE